MFSTLDTAMNTQAAAFGGTTKGAAAAQTTKAVPSTIATEVNRSLPDLTVRSTRRA